MIKIHCLINEKQIEAEVEAGERAVDFLRDRLGLTGTKEGCGQGECGSCTILVDNMTVHACLMLAASLDGKVIETIENGENNRQIQVIQKAFLEKGAVQCGFCTPGMIMSVHGLLLKKADPSEEEIRKALEGNLCRCTGYQTILDAVRYAVKLITEEEMV